MTRVLGDGNIHLTRRTAVGASGRHEAQQLVTHFADELKLVRMPPMREGHMSEDRSGDDDEALVTAPAVQVLPLAIYV